MFQPKWQFNAHKDASNSTNSRTSGDVERGTPFNRDSDSSKLGQLVGKLPHELLTEVFSWCCPTYENRNFRAPPYSVLDLSHVCSYWREVALHSPHLWTHLRLAVDSYYIGCLDKPSQLLKLWLSRAQNCPLVVDIDFHEHPRLQSPENILRSVKSFISTAVENKASIDSENMELRAALVTTASRGVRFHRISEKYSWANPSARFDRLFPGSVQININKCANIVYGLEGHSNLGPYLTHLDLRDAYNHVLFSVEECQIILSNFPRLEHCAMRLGRSAGADVETINTLYSLRTLLLVWQDVVDIAPLLDSIIAPALQQLELDGLLPAPNFPVERTWDHLLQFLRRSAPPLRSIALNNMDCHSLDLLGCLAVCNGIKHLTLENCSLGEEIIQPFLEGRYAHHAQALHALMGLEFFALVSCDIFDFVNLLRSVSMNVLLFEKTRLETLYIFDCGYIPQDVMTALGELPLEKFGASFDQQAIE